VAPETDRDRNPCTRPKPVGYLTTFDNGKPLSVPGIRH